MSPTDPFGLVGQVLEGQFRVDAMIGEGGFSAVYRGLHLGLGEPIAIKCLTVQTALGPAVVDSLLTRFREESRLLYRLSQGNLDIVRSIASGTTTAPATGAMVPYMVLEWLEGRSLANELIVRRTEGATGRPLHEAIAMLDSAADALAYAHSLGVVHRDLNPGNLFLAQTRTGPRMKVLDFGVAKVIRDEVLALGPRAQTLQSVRIFTPAYAAPEQFDDRIAAVSPATDVWALAIILMEVMSDRLVFDGEALGEFFQKVLDPAYPRTPRARGGSVGDSTEKVFAKAVSMSPLERQRDVGVFWAELRLALSKDVGGSTIKGSSNPFQPGMGMEPTQTAKVDHVVVVPAPMPSLISAPMSTTVRLDNSFSYEATVLTGALAPGETKPSAKPLVSMTDVKTTMRMAQSAVPQAAPDGLFQGAAVAPPPGSQFSTTAPNPPKPEVPQLEPSQTTAKTRKPPTGGGVLVAVVVAVVLVAAAGVGLAVYRARTRVAPTATPSPSSPPPSSAARTPSTPPTITTAIVVAPPSSIAPEASASAASSGSTTVGPRPNPKGFSPKAARTALDTPNSILAACSGMTGPGMAHVTFANDGSVTQVTIDKPYIGAEADCIAAKLKRARMPPFEGASRPVDYTFTIAR